MPNYFAVKLFQRKIVLLPKTGKRRREIEKIMVTGVHGETGTVWNLGIPFLKSLFINNNSKVLGS